MSPRPRKDYGAGFQPVKSRPGAPGVLNLLAIICLSAMLLGAVSSERKSSGSQTSRTGSQAAKTAATPKQAPAKKQSMNAKQASRETVADTTLTATYLSVPRKPKLSAKQAEAVKIVWSRPVITITSPRMSGFPYDPYELGSHFLKRWDLLHFVMTPSELAVYRRDSAMEGVRRIARIFTRLSEAGTQRRANMSRAAAALHLMRRANNTPLYWHPSPSLLHIAGFRAAIESDAADARVARDSYEPLRDALNAAVEKARLSESAAAAEQKYQTAVFSPTSRYAITESVMDAVVRAQEQALAECSLSPAAAAALDDASRYLRRSSARVLLASLGPPSPSPMPAYHPLVPDDTPLPDGLLDPSGVSARAIPRRPLPALRSHLIPAPAGATVLAAADGKVLFAGELRGYERLVIMEHSGDTITLYGMLSDCLVSAGQTVDKGQPIGRAGKASWSGAAAASGVVFEVRRKGALISPASLTGGAPPEKIILQSRREQSQ
ncbi:MAG: M23 family metallopeptidase [bacterium]|nr:M23 family metallopeptidase [Candidatus Sumerlaeota bacterium]